MPDAHPTEPDEAEMEAMIAAWKDRGGQVQRLKLKQSCCKPLGYAGFNADTLDLIEEPHRTKSSST